MPKARKLPSGNWRVQVMIKGKRYSFTGKTKKEVERQAALAQEQDPEMNITLYEAITRYIDSKEQVLSPSTIRGYCSYRDKFLDESIAEIPMNKITIEKLQQAINICALDHSAKSCDNLRGLLAPVMRMFRPEFTFSLTVPPKEVIERMIPTDAELKKILEVTRWTDLDLPVRMAAFGSLRISEISGLCPDCVFQDHIAIRRALVRDRNSNWVLKTTPKSYAGNRDVYYPEEIMVHLRSMAGYCRNNEPLFGTPSSINGKWSRMIKKEGLPPIGFHSLRHYYATYCLGMGINEKIVQKNGGWSDLSTMKKRYQHIIEEKELEARSIVYSQFSKLENGE